MAFVSYRCCSSSNNKSEGMHIHVRWLLPNIPEVSVVLDNGFLQNAPDLLLS